MRICVFEGTYICMFMCVSGCVFVCACVCVYACVHVIVQYKTDLFMARYITYILRGVHGRGIKVV